MIFLLVIFALLPVIFWESPRIAVWLLVSTSFLGSLRAILRRDTSTKARHDVEMPREIILTLSCLSFLMVIEFIHFDSDSLNGCLYLAASLATCYAGYQEMSIQKSQLRKKYEVNFVLFILLLILIFLIFSSQLDKTDQGVNTNFIGGIVLALGFLLMSCYVFCYSHIVFIVLFIAVILMISSTRSVIVGLILGAVMAFGFKNNRHRLFFMSLACLLLVVAMPWLVDFFTDPYVNTIFMDTTGKNLETGRLMVWRLFFDDLDWEKFLIGAATGANYMLEARDFNSNISGISIHNGYLSVLARSGVFILFIFLSFLYVIFYSLGEQKEIMGQARLAFFLAFCIREFFEVTLHANNFPIAALFWFSVGAVLSRSTTK